MSKKTGLIEEHHATIYKMWAAGKNDYEIEDIIHLSPNYIRDYRNKQRWVKKYRTVPHAELDAYLKDPANKDEPGSKIAIKFGCCHSMVNGKRRKLGLSLKADGVPSKTEVVIGEPTRTVNYANEQEAYLSYLHKQFPIIRQTFSTVDEWKKEMKSRPHGIGERLLAKVQASYR